MICSVCGDEHEEGTTFMVTLRRDGRDRPEYSPILGPYPTHLVAFSRVSQGRRLAERVDPRAVWYTVGTVTLKPGSTAVGLLNKEAAEDDGEAANEVLRAASKKRGKKAPLKIEAYRHRREP